MVLQGFLNYYILLYPMHAILPLYNLELIKLLILVVAVGFSQDLILILSTEKHQRMQNKQTNKQELIYYKTKRRRNHCEEYMLCVTASNNILENANCEEDIAVFFYKCVYPTN